MNFQSSLETDYQDFVYAARKRQSLFASVIGLAIYDLWFYADYLLLDDIVGFAAIVRFGIVTPVGLAVIAFSAWVRSWRARELCQSIIVVIVAASFTVMELQSAALGRIFHHFGFVEVIVYAAIVQRLPFKYALAAIAALTALHLLTVLQLHEIDLHMQLAANWLVVCAALLILVASFTAERWERQRFLMTLLDQARVAELDRLLRCDALTGLANRRSLDECLARDLRGPVGILLLDVDAFKRYNDTYGHQQGDHCLHAVAQAVLSAVEGATIVARYGGEEIVAVIEEANADALRAVAERVRAAVQALALPHAASGTSRVVTVSVGVACGPRRGDAGLIRLIRDADAALYAAKAAGRNCVAVHGAPPPALERAS